MLSEDPILSAVLDLFPEPLAVPNPVEQQPCPPARARMRVLRRALSVLRVPEVIGAAAFVTLVMCVTLGIVLNSTAIALFCLGVTLCLGVVCDVEIRRRRRLGRRSVSPGGGQVEAAR
jgi:hypothetical protein